MNSLRDSANDVLEYSIARSIYETSSTKPLPEVTVRNIIHSAALNAFDNASNPNRTRGGLKKCHEMYVMG